MDRSRRFPDRHASILDGPPRLRKGLDSANLTGMELSLWPGLAPGADPSIPNLPRLTAYPLEPTRAVGGAGRLGPAKGAVIVLPGGGYVGHADYEGEPVARWLNSIGYCAFVLNYRVAPYRHPWPLADVQRAVRCVRHQHERWGVEPDRIGVLGFSAGGHLAGCAGILRLKAYEALDETDAVDPRPDFMVLCYPVISFGPYRHDGSMRNLLGDDPDPDLRRILSLETSVDSHSAPAFLWHTANDDLVPVQNSLLLADALARSSVPCELHVFPDGAHGAAMAADRADLRVWTTLCEAWLQRVGRKRP